MNLAKYALRSSSRVESAGEEWKVQLIDVLAMQYDRWRRANQNLPQLTKPEILRSLGVSRGPLLCVDGKGGVEAAAVPTVERYSADSDKLAYYRPSTGTTELLVIRDSDALLTGSVQRLITMLESSWIAQDATGANMVWPYHDFDIGATLYRHGFAPDAIIAYQSSNDLAKNLRGPAPKQKICTRFGSPKDLASLVALQEEVLAAHIPLSPFAHRVPTVATQFRERLARMWEGQPAGTDVPIVTVAEQNGDIIGMSEGFVKLSSRQFNMLLPPGRYGYINTFGVFPKYRGSGIGTYLARAVAASLLDLDIKGIYLYFSVYNKPAETFWKKMGYDPLWRTYQRHDLRESA